jgi:uncharacterized protein YndB with AHSA1/START domain
MRAKKVGLGVLVAIVLLLAIIATRPAGFHIERSATIAAPPEVVFAQLNDLHHWHAWNPFEKGDPTMKTTFEGAPSGVGAGFHYVSENAGEGRMTVTESTPNERVAIRAEFIKPFAATNQIEFTLKPGPNGVALTWAMSGNNHFLGKAISLFVSMDKMIGGQFEKGLADLRQVSEMQAKQADEKKHGGA